MSTPKDSGQAADPELEFLQDLSAFDESDRIAVREYLLCHPDAIEPLRWLVKIWGAENTRLEWFGVPPDLGPDHHPENLSPFWAHRLPFSATPSPERQDVFAEFKRLFPKYKAHMGVMP